MVELQLMMTLIRSSAATARRADVAVVVAAAVYCLIREWMDGWMGYEYLLTPSQLHI